MDKKCKGCKWRKQAKGNNVNFYCTNERRNKEAGVPDGKVGSCLYIMSYGSSICKEYEREEYKMNFYEFNDYEYYGLVLATDEESAKQGYVDIIANIEDDDLNSHPDIISQEEALERYKEGIIDGLNTVEEKIEDFNGIIDVFKKHSMGCKNTYYVLLMDRWLY